MKKEFVFVWTYYDDIIVDDIYSSCGRYAQDEEIYRGTYWGAIIHYYHERARLTSDDARGVAPDFYICKFARFIFHDFRYMVKSEGCTRPQYFYTLRLALREAVKSNVRAIKNLVKLVLMSNNPRALKCAIDIYKLEREKITMIFA